MAGREIFMKRQQLRSFNDSYRPQQFLVENPFTSTKTTEVQITSEFVGLATESATDLTGKADGRPPSTLGPGYTVTINSAPRSPPQKSPSLSPNIRMSSFSMSSRRTDLQRRNNRAAMEANTAAWSYTKCAILFFISLLVTWVPSSINRVYSLIHPELISVPFTYFSAVVLPLMGFWNSVIYITTSWTSCKRLGSRILGHTTAKVSTARRFSRSIGHPQPGIIVRKPKPDGNSDSEVPFV